MNATEAEANQGTDERTFPQVRALKKAFKVNPKRKNLAKKEIKHPPGRISSTRESCTRTGQAKDQKVISKLNMENLERSEKVLCKQLNDL